MPLITALRQALGLPPRLILFLLLGKHFLSFLAEESGEAKVIDALLGCVRLLHKRHLLLENGDLGKPILGEMRLH